MQGNFRGSVRKVPMHATDVRSTYALQDEIRLLLRRALGKNLHVAKQVSRRRLARRAFACFCGKDPARNVTLQSKNFVQRERLRTAWESA